MIRILSYNIRHGGRGRERQIASVINAVSPDVVVLQEATRPDVVARVAASTGMQAFGSLRRRSLGFLSRVPVAEHHWVRPRWSQHAFLELVLADGGLRIFGVHLSAVHASWTEARRVHELRALLAAIKAHGESHHVLLGDFNTIAPDERLDVSRLPYRLRLLVWLSGGRIRWQTIAIVLGAGYEDAFRMFDATEPGYTFPTWDPHVRLDYAFVPRQFTARVAACAVVTGAAGVGEASDHYPLQLDLH